MESINELCDQTSDSNVLEHVLCLLTQASTALKTVNQSLPEKELCSFEVKEGFAASQKNEKQLRLWKTSKDPGRKSLHPPMKYVVQTNVHYMCACIHSYIYSYVRNYHFLFQETR